MIRSLIWWTSPLRELFAEFQAALAPGDVFPPGLGRQGVRVWRGPVPAVALGDILDAGLDFRGERDDIALVIDDAVADGCIDVAVGVITEQPPQRLRA